MAWRSTNNGVHQQACHGRLGRSQTALPSAAKPFCEQYNALGKRNLAAIEQIVATKYQRGPAFNCQYPFVDILLSDIMESEETLDTSKLVREPRPPSFQRMPR